MILGAGGQLERYLNVHKWLPFQESFRDECELLPKLTRVTERAGYFNGSPEIITGTLTSWLSNKS